MKKIAIDIEELEILLDAYDGWVGSLHPDERDEYLAHFDHLRSRLENKGDQVLSKQ